MLERSGDPCTGIRSCRGAGAPCTGILSRRSGDPCTGIRCRRSGDPCTGISSLGIAECSAECIGWYRISEVGRATMGSNGGRDGHVPVAIGVQQVAHRPSQGSGAGAQGRVYAVRMAFQDLQQARSGGFDRALRTWLQRAITASGRQAERRSPWTVFSLKGPRPGCRQLLAPSPSAESSSSSSSDSVA